MSDGINSVYLAEANKQVATLGVGPSGDVTRNLARILQDYDQKRNAQLAERRKQESEDMAYILSMDMLRTECGDFSTDSEGNDVDPYCLLVWWSEDGDELEKRFDAPKRHLAIHAAAEWLREQVAKWENEP